jgi:hypothetical protein
MDKDVLFLVLGVFFGFLVGIPSSFVASAWYDHAKVGRSRKAAILRKKDDLWRKNLSSNDAELRTKAFQELVVLVLEKFILGNVFFAISGITWIFEFFGMVPSSNFLVAATSLAAVFFFAQSLFWIKRYYAYSNTIKKQAEAEFLSSSP